jgi:formate dehydrogenase subunit gamma
MNITSDQHLLIHELIESHQSMKGALLPLLHAIQDHIGHVPPESVSAIAVGLNLSRAEVHGVISYYHFFKTQPAGKHTLQVCRAESCQACGAEDLMALAENILGCKTNAISSNGAVTLEAAYCLGLCASSPAIQLDDRLYARVSAQKLKDILSQLEASP